MKGISHVTYRREHSWCLRYRTAAGAVELHYYVAAEMYTATAVAAPFYRAALPALPTP